MLGVLERHEADKLVIHPRGFEVFGDAVGDGSPEAWRAALETLNGSMPWWLTERGWQREADHSQALIEDEARKFVGTNVAMFDRVNVGL